MSDEEPERYHEWILWKLKQERKMSEDQLELDFTSHLGEGITTTDSIIRRENMRHDFLNLYEEVI